MKDSNEFTYQYHDILACFHTLRLHGKHIQELDSELIKFINVKELSLTGNLIKHVKNIPPQVELLHLNANKYFLFRSLMDTFNY